MADTSHLEALFKQIRDEKGLHANTAWRVGTALLEIIPFLDGTFAVDTASETWVTDHFVTKSYFESLFELYDADSKIATNGTIPVDRSKVNIKAMFGFWAEQYISSLGRSANGNSGGDTLLEPLRSINNAGLGMPVQAGVGIIWDGTRWTYGQTSSATGTVTSVKLSMPTGFSVSGSPITSIGTLAVTFADGYSLPQTAKQSNWDAAYGWGNHADAGYIKTATGTFWGQSWINGGAVSGNMTNVGTMTFKANNLALSTSFTDQWSDGTNDHPWYGYDHRYHNTGVFSTTISDYHGLTLRTASGYLCMQSGGNVGIGTSDPSYKLHVSGYAFTSRLYLASGVYLEYDSGNGGVHLVGAGLYTDSYVSALGLSANGNAGDTLLEPLRSINNADLGTPAQANVGIVWNGSRWTYGQTSSATGSVSSVAMTVPTGFSISGSPVTNRGTLAVTFASGYSLPTTAKQSNWDTAYSNSHIHSNKSVLDGITSSNVSNWDAAYGWGNHANAGYIKTATGTFWGQSWINGGAVSGNMTNVGTMTFKANNLAISTSFTDQWSDGTNDHPWYGYDHRYPDTGVFSTTISDYHGLTLRTASGYLCMQSGGNVGIGTTAPGAKLDVAGSIRSSNSLLAQAIELSYSTPYIDFHYNNASSDYTSRIIASASGILSIEALNAAAALKIGEYYDGSFLQIGGIRLVYESSNNSLKVVKNDGTAANFYATGGVSALGNSVGGTSSGSDDSSVKTYHFTKNTSGSGYWHRLGSFITSGPSYNLVVEIFDGSGFNGNGHQNARSIVTIKGAQVQDSTRRVGISCERFTNGGTYSNGMRVRVRMTSNTAGELWVRFPYQWTYGDYIVYGNYTQWLHNSGISDDTTSAPVTSGSKVLQTGSTVYYDYSVSVSEESY